MRVIGETLIAYIRDCEALVLREEHCRAQIKNSFPPRLIQKCFSGGIPDSKEGLRISVANRSVMSIDLVDSTAKFSECSAEEHYRIINFYVSELDKIISTYQGVTIKHLGDGLLAIFDNIYKERDFAKFAVLCASSCLAKARELSKTPPIAPKSGEGDFFSSRIGIATGHFVVAVVGDGGLTDVDAIGKTVNIAARLQSAAPPDTISIDLETYQQSKVATTKGPLKGLFSRVTLDAPLKGTTVTDLYRLTADGLTPSIEEEIREKGETLAAEALKHEERLLALRTEAE